MSRIVLLRMDGDDQVEIRMSGNTTWMEVTERFVQFLQGCGYQVTAQDVSEYLSGEDTDPTEELPIEISGSHGATITNSSYTFEPLTIAIKQWNPNQ